MNIDEDDLIYAAFIAMAFIFLAGVVCLTF